MADYPVLNEVRRGYFPKDPPASAVVVVKELVRADLLVEVEPVAEAPSARAGAGKATRTTRRVSARGRD